MVTFQIVGLLVILAFSIFFYLFKIINRNGNKKCDKIKEEKDSVSSPISSSPEKVRKKHHHHHKGGLGGIQKAGGGIYEEKKNVLEKVTHHPLYINVLRGFAGAITSVACHPTKDMIAVSCSDMTVRVFDVTDKNCKYSSNIPYVRTNIETEYFTACDFSHDGTLIIGALESSRHMVILKIAKSFPENKNLTVVYKGNRALQRNTVRWLFASQGKWIVTASEDDDTEVNIWSYSGELLSSYNTKQVKNFQLCVSPLDCRFVLVAAWSPGVKLMEIKSKGAEFSKLEKAMDLKSLKGLRSVCVSSNHKYAITADKGAVVTLWNIDVRYVVSEDPKQILSIEEVDERFKNYTMMSFCCNDKRVVAVADNNIKIMDPFTLQTLEVIECAHSVNVGTLAVSRISPFFVTGASDNRPRLWKIPI